MPRPSVKLTIQYQVERVRGAEVDNPEEALGLIKALGQFAAENQTVNSVLSNAALNVQASFIDQVNSTNQAYPLALTIDDDERTSVRGALTPNGDYTDIQSLALAGAIRSFIPKHTEVHQILPSA